ICLSSVAWSGNSRIAGAATRPNPVVVVAAYAFVQAYELLRRNHAVLKRFETILHADIVVRQLDLRIAVRVDKASPLRFLNIVNGTAHALRPDGGIIGDRCR